MPVYKDKSHEDQRFEHYGAGDQGGIVNGGSTRKLVTSSNLFTEVTGPSTRSQRPAPHSTVVEQPVVNPIPFEELPAMTRLTITQPGSTISVQFGISSIPAPNSVRVSIADPRENLKALVVSTELKCGTNASKNGNEQGVSSENITNKEPQNVVNINLTVHDDPVSHEYKTSKENIDEIMPQLSHLDYYTEPPIKQLAEKEMAEPGFCSRVKDFQIGRFGYGNIKFLGETDVRKLCLDSLVEFDNHKIVFYKNEKEKPPVGKGLHKLAEVTMLNVECVDKKTGKRYVEGEEVERYKEMLMKKGEEQGAEFISFDPVKGEWKFRVQHF